MLKRLLLAGLIAAGAEAEGPKYFKVPAGKHGEFPAYVPGGPSKETPCPLLVAFHGSGDTAGNFLDCLKGLADMGPFAILAPEGAGKYADGFDWDNFPDRGATVESAIRALLQAHPEVDPKRVVWLGHSTGSYVCCEDGASRPSMCAGIVLNVAQTVALSCSPKAPKPRVALFMGTEDFNFQAYSGHRDSLKSSKGPFSINQVKGQGHALVDLAYLAAAVHWVLESEGANEENVLPKEPPGNRSCRHLLIPLGKRTADAARKEAQKTMDAMKKEKPEKWKGKGEPLSSEEPLLKWACWTVPKDAIRLVRSPEGFHLVWAD